MKQSNTRRRRRRNKAIRMEIRAGKPKLGRVDVLSSINLRAEQQLTLTDSQPTELYFTGCGHMNKVIVKVDGAVRLVYSFPDDQWQQYILTIPSCTRLRQYSYSPLCVDRIPMGIT